MLATIWGGGTVMTLASLIGLMPCADSQSFKMSGTELAHCPKSVLADFARGCGLSHKDFTNKKGVHITQARVGKTWQTDGDAFVLF